MRPVRLTLQAFGPYADRQVIDFRDALQSGLFGIYGQTGSGKSTIFSSMTFALFGEAAKSEQDRASLRSDHADPGLVTEVEFVFDVADRRFVIVRQPEQMRPKQRGGGETRSAHEAFLFDATGLAPEDITPANRGRILAEKKVNDVRSAVEELLGYGPEQFRQIVLLPQGRFERFLAAKTTDRLSILRDLFDVSVYQALMAELKAQADAAEQHVREERALCSKQLLAEGFTGPEALLAGISETETALAERLAAEREASERATEAQSRLQQGEAQEARLTEADRAQEQLAALAARTPEFDALASRLEMAGKARLLLDLEAQTMAANEEMQAARQQTDATAQAFSEASNRAEEAAHRLEQAEADARLIEDLQRQKAELQRYAGILEAASASAGEVEASLQARERAALALESVRTELSGLRDLRMQTLSALKSARECQMRRAMLSQQQASLSARLEAARAWESACAQLAGSRAELETQRRAAEDAETAEQAALRRFETAETALASARALALAARLQAGSPCPVCGSVDHPAPATGAASLSGLEQDFREARQALEQARQVSRAVHERLSALTATLAERQAGHDLQRQPDQPSLALSGEVRDIETALQALGEPQDPEQAERALEAVEAKSGRLEEEMVRLREHYEQLSQEAAVTSARRETKLAEIPEDLRSTGRLAAALAEVGAQLDGLIRAREGAREAARSTRESALAASAAVEAAGRMEAACRERLERSARAFRLRLSQLDLSQERYEAVKPAIETFAADTASLEHFRRRLHEAEGAARAAREAVEGITRPDLESLRAASEEAAQGSDVAIKARMATASRLAFLTELRARIEGTLRRLEEAEAASGPLRQLAARVGGDNPLSLRLETFALAAMFDQVLEAANLRLGPMTCWRYRMDRSMEGGRGSRGLGIEVFDAHTGKSRATDTLSGGETFIAALSLALGLADIVEAANGRIRLDTIFIDEGFGSLDTENGSGTLEQVLQVLGSLVRQSRAVGLISHVPLVQEAIPNGFYVRKGPGGSRIEERRLG